MDGQDLILEIQQMKKVSVQYPIQYYKIFHIYMNDMMGDIDGGRWIWYENDLVMYQVWNLSNCEERQRLHNIYIYIS